jgi:hypothetical protein
MEVDDDELKRLEEVEAAAFKADRPTNDIVE